MPCWRRCSSVPSVVQAERTRARVSSMSRPLELAVVIPTFNEAANVHALVERLDAALTGRAWEAIFVDDDSPDGTARAAREIARADRRVRVIQRIGRRGLSSACIEGMCATAAPLRGGDRRRPAARRDDPAGDARRAAGRSGARRGDRISGSSRAAAPATGIATGWPNRPWRRGFRGRC